jgi:vitamin B12 transporter
MRIQWPGSIIGLLAIGASVVANADTADSEDNLQPVVLTATRIATPQSQLASSITVITAEQIAASQATSLPDVLKFVPGLNLVQSGAEGGVTSIFMRGTNSNHTKVLVDGIDVSDPSNTGATFDFGQFLTSDIERIEVLRGPQSGLYGSDAIGGVINIITKSGEGPAQVSASVEGGSFESFNQAASVRGSEDEFHYAFNVEHLHAAATPVTPLDLLQPGEARNDDYYDNLTASTKLGVDVTSNLDFGFIGRYTDTHLRFTADDFDAEGNGFPAPLSSETDTTGIYGRSFAHLLAFDGFLDSTLGVDYTHNKSTNLTPDSPDTFDTGERVKVDWQAALRFSDSQTLLLGAEHAHDTISEPLSAGINIDSGYAELQSRFDDRFYSAINLRYDDNDRFGSKLTYRIAPTYVIADSGTQLRASVGTGFKAPTLAELFQNFPAFFFFANPNLRPESSIGYDVGVEQALAGDSVHVGATYFHIKLHDLIDTAPDGMTYANIDQATSLGVESFLSYRPWSALTLRLDYTYDAATDDLLHEELLRRPKNKSTLNARWQASSALSFNTDVLYVGNWIDGNRDFTIPRLNAPGYLTLNIAGSYDLTSQIALTARIDNLLDRHYEEPIGFLQPSIGLFAGVKARL